MISPSVFRAVPSLVLAGILALVASPVGAGEQPASDTAFIKSHMTAINKVRDKVLAQGPNPIGTLEGIRELAALRRDALIELDAKHPLTTLDGIETMDDFDAGAVLALHDMTAAFVASDTTRPQAEQLAQFNSVLGGIPSLGDSPVGFMVFGLTDMALSVTDTLWAAPEVSQTELAKTGVNLVHLVADRYVQSLGDDNIIDAAFMKKSNRFRTNSVIMRMRCPKDDSVYRIVDIKNRAAANGDILSTYFIQCQTCDDPRVVEFVQEFQSRLNRMSDRQQGQGKQGRHEEPVRPGKGVEP